MTKDLAGQHTKTPLYKGISEKSMEKRDLAKALSFVYVHLDIGGKTKEDVLFNVACLAKQHGLVNNEKALYNELIERENKALSAIGFGLAVLEASRIRENRAYAFILCRLKEPVDFKFRYRCPVRIILFSLGSKKADLIRFKAMLYLSTLLKSAGYRRRLMQVKKNAEVYELLREIAGNCGRKLRR